MASAISSHGYRGNCSYFIKKGPTSISKGFSLIELFAVVVILALLMALLLPSMPRIMESERRTVCMENLRLIGAAAMSYAADNNGALPIAGYSDNYPMGACVDPQFNGPGVDPKEKGIVYLLPYFGAPGVTEAAAENKGYVVNFFCPSGPATFEHDWQYHLDRTAGYVQYCGWGYSGLAQPGYFVNSPGSLRDGARKLLWCDIACIGGASPLANHMGKNGMPAGSNCLFLDAHVEWVDISRLTVKTYPLVPGTYLFPDTN